MLDFVQNFSTFTGVYTVSVPQLKKRLGTTALDPCASTFQIPGAADRPDTLAANKVPSVHRVCGRHLNADGVSGTSATVCCEIFKYKFAELVDENHVIIFTVVISDYKILNS